MDGPTPKPEDRKLGGLVLCLIGFATYGATCPFAAVLSIEWLLDPRRKPELRQYDKAGAVIGVIGTWIWATVTGLLVLDPYGFGTFYGPPVLMYWAAFGIWVACRMATRWRDIAAAREARDED